MQELTELRFEDNRLMLQNNLVRSPILPKIASELERDIVFQGDCIVEGAVYARNLHVEQGPLRVKAPVFTQVELHVNVDARGDIVFEKAVGSANGVVSHALGAQLYFLSDINAKQVRLRNAYVSASIFADDIVLEDCVVVGGVFASRSLELTNCVIGTFNSPTVRCAKTIYFLLPSAFSVESVSCSPGTTCHNLTLADLGALMRGTPEMKNTGRIGMDLTQDEQRTVLVADGIQQILRSYSVVGKVLAADMSDIEKLQNHFLLTTAALGSQLLRTYDLGLDANGERVAVTPERVAALFFDILDGKIAIQELSGSFALSDLGVDASRELSGRQTASDEQQGDEVSAPESEVCAECGAPLSSDDVTCPECGMTRKG